MLGSEFVALYANKGYVAWEAAALAMAEQGELTPWPFIDLALSDDAGNKAVLKVQADVLSVGSFTDHLRLPLLPGHAQDICNLTGALLPTPKLVWRIWQNALQLKPVDAGDMGQTNKGANMLQYAKHSAIIDGQIEASSGNKGGLVAGIKKHIVASNLYATGKVVIFGWYRQHPPFPDVFDDKQPMVTPGRQPIQPHSNFHNDQFVDYSHGVQLVAGRCLLNGEEIDTVDLYQHPTLSKMVSHDGPVRVPRYPSKVPVKNRPVRSEVLGRAAFSVIARVPTTTDIGLGAIADLTQRARKT